MGDQDNVVRYSLAESVLTFDATVDYTTDTYADGEQAGRPTTEVTLGVRGSSDSLSLDLDDESGNSEFSVTLTPDQRLATLSFKTVGAGGQVVQSVGTLIGVVAAAAAGLRPGGLRPAAPRPADREPTNDNTKRPKVTPEERARAAWDASHETEAALIAGSRTLITDQANALLARRQRLLEAQPADERDLLASIGRLQRVLEESRDELARLESLYKGWRAGTITRRTVSHVEHLTIADLPVAAPGATLVPETLGERARQVWDATGAMVQVEQWAAPAPAPVVEKIPARTFGEQYASVRAEPVSLDERVVWRVARPVTLSVWTRTSAGVELTRRFPARVLDAASEVRSIPLEDRFFGEESVEIHFDADGNLSSVGGKATSAVASFLESLGTVPESVAGGIATALKARTDLASIADAADVRRVAAAKRQLEQLQAELDLKGLAATSDDVARLASLTQQVSIAEAEGTLAPPGETARLEAEAKLVEARTKLADAHRTEALEQEIGSLRSEIARLALEVEKAKLTAKEAVDGG